jgi:hypothetical protein
LRSFYNHGRTMTYFEKIIYLVVVGIGL